MVPGAGIEPAQPYGREILSLLCLPISPSGLKQADYTCPEKGKRESACALSLFYLEREKSLELSTYTLARYRSTN